MSVVKWKNEGNLFIAAYKTIKKGLTFIKCNLDYLWNKRAGPTFY